MPLANSSWVLPRGVEDWLAKGFDIELYTLPLDGSGLPGPTFSFQTLDEVANGLLRCDLPLTMVAVLTKDPHWTPWGTCWAGYAPPC